MAHAHGSYDSLVAAYLSEHTEEPAVKSRQYVQEKVMKYGVNPHQLPATVSRISGRGFPFEVRHSERLRARLVAADTLLFLRLPPLPERVTCSRSYRVDSLTRVEPTLGVFRRCLHATGLQLGHVKVRNGAPGYTNIMDALNAWQLVKELNEALGLAAAASFKHVSPAGAAVAVPLTPELAAAYGVEGQELSDVALAYIRARNADPMSSYGDFAAISGVVDVATAKILKREVSDGVIAAGFEPEALEILKSKKGGRYLVLEAVAGYEPPADEVKEVFGAMLSQKRNDAVITTETVSNCVTEATIPDSAKRDLVIATITVKYTQSNSVCYAQGGQIVGVGAGQQSRVDCVKLAGRKVDVWYCRLAPKVINLPFKEGVKVGLLSLRVAAWGSQLLHPPTYRLLMSLALAATRRSSRVPFSFVPLHSARKRSTRASRTSTTI